MHGVFGKRWRAFLLQNGSGDWWIDIAVETKRERYVSIEDETDDPLTHHTLTK